MKKPISHLDISEIIITVFIFGILCICLYWFVSADSAIEQSRIEFSQNVSGMDLANQENFSIFQIFLDRFVFQISTAMDIKILAWAIMAPVGVCWLIYLYSNEKEKEKEKKHKEEKEREAKEEREKEKKRDEQLKHLEERLEQKIIMNDVVEKRKKPEYWFDVHDY